MSWKNLKVGPWSIASALSVAIGGLVFVAVLVVLTTQLISNRASVLELVRDNIHQAFETIETALEDHLSPVADQVEFLGRLIDSGRYQLDERGRLQDLFTGALAATPQIDGIFLTEPDLRFLGVGQTSQGEIKILTKSRIDPARRRAMSESVEASDGARWYELVNVDGRTFLNLRRPLRRDGEYLGFLVAVVSMAELSQMMADFGDAHDETAFILHGEGSVLAHPALVSPHPDLSEQQPVVAIDRVGDLVLSALPEGRVMPDMADLENYGIEILHVDIGDQAYMVGTKRMDRYGPVPWHLGAWVPMDNLMDTMRPLHIAALTGLAIAVFAVVLAIVLGRLLARPIRRVAAESAKVGLFDLEHVERLPSSAISELNDQATAFNAMLAGLQSFSRYVPRRLVMRLIQSGAGDELESGERELTVMFTDIVGFTAMSEQLPARDVADFLNQHFTLLATCVEAEEGTIDKFIGDALMAFWGAPEAQDDHAQRACRAAQAIAAAVAADNAERAAAGLAPIRVRIGVHGGPVVVGNIGAPGRINYTIVGDTVNTCQRLESLGRNIDTDDAVTILVSEATARAVETDFVLEPAGSYEVKGRTEQVQAFRLMPG
ncbi:MAG: adenylate/guanylate cyclase domain-containing protein [Kiloniellales bacterium]